MKALFITGTDTGVGKTHAACVIARQLAACGLRVGAYKPACSGAERNNDGAFLWDDVERLRSAINVAATVDEICPQRFVAPLAPPLAARAEGKTVDGALLRAGVEAWRDRVDVLLVEGAGGILCPLTDVETFADLAVDLAFPALIVARTGLGTINHTLLTVEAARRRGVTVAGVILCESRPNGDDPSIAGNPAEIERRSGAPILGVIPHGNSAELLREGKPVSLNWLLLAGSGGRE